MRRAAESGSIDWHLIAVQLVWRRIRSRVESKGPLDWTGLAADSAIAFRHIEAALTLDPDSALARAYAARLARWVRTYNLWRHDSALAGALAYDPPWSGPGDASAAPAGGDWVLYKLADISQAAPALFDAQTGSGRHHLIAAIVYFRRCHELAYREHASREELESATAIALAHARAAAHQSDATLGVLRMLHTVIMFCQQHDLHADASAGEDLGTTLDWLIRRMHEAAETAGDLSWDTMSSLRKLVVRHYLYDTGEMEKGVALAEQYARRLRVLPDAPSHDPEPPHRLFAEDWVGYIGHLCLFDYYIKAKLLGAMQWDRLSVVALSHMRVANRALLDRWRPWLDVVTDRQTLETIGSTAQREIVGMTMRIDGREWYWAAACADVQRRWECEGRGPLLQLSPADHERARPLLTRLGLPPGRPHVCVHARESGYHKESGTHSQAHRNADIMAFVPTMKYLVEQGYTVVRMGDPTMRPLPPIDGVIDYPHHPAREPWLDIYLVASASFFVGCTSGLVMVAHVFGTPTALSHFVPPCARPYTKDDLFLPRLYWSEREHRLLSFAEALTPPLATTFYYERVRGSGVTVLDPSDDDITELAKEMIERQRGTLVYSDAENARQARYDALNARVPWFGSNGRVGRAFLRAQAALLEADAK